MSGPPRKTHSPGRPSVITARTWLPSWPQGWLPITGRRPDSGDRYGAGPTPAEGSLRMEGSIQEVDARRARWFRHRQHQKLANEAGDDFALGGLGRHVDELDLRLLFLPSDPDALLDAARRIGARWLLAFPTCASLMLLDHLRIPLPPPQSIPHDPTRTATPSPLVRSSGTDFAELRCIHHTVRPSCDNPGT